MRWFKRRKPPVLNITEFQHEEPDPFEHSPFNADVITPDDPGWAIFAKAMETGGPVVGTYDGETGEIVSIEPYQSYPPTHHDHTVRMWYDAKSCSCSITL
jgi:hypothetical protein